MLGTSITTIVLGGISANCYLLKTQNGFILIDTGWVSKRAKLEKVLSQAGCNPGNLKLVLLTHGDFDHSGNCVYLRKKYGAPIAMNYEDFGMVQYGDMFYNRKAGISFVKKIVNIILRIDRFTPDFSIDEGYDLSLYGLAAKILDLPGHSKGSIGILTATGDLFCGDMFSNTDTPKLNPNMDDMEAAQQSYKKLKAYPIQTVYPGHGKPFAMSELKTATETHVITAG